MCVRIAWIMMTLTALAPHAGGQQTVARARAASSGDTLQTIQARQLLRDEPELAGHNIGVTVHNRVATLWGPVASAEVIFRAELCLRTMRELAAVRNELFVSELHEDARPRKIERPPAFLPERVPPKLPIDPLQVPQVQAPEPKPAKTPATIQVTARGAAAPPTPPAAGPLTQTERELTTAVRAILQSSPAYRGVQFVVQAGRVYLRIDAGDSTPLHEAARAVARLPNVEGVVILESRP